MGVYIKGMEMPKDGERLYWVVIHSDGTVEYNKNKGQGWQTSEAIFVPPHGRLIDAEVLEDNDPDVCNSFMRDGYVESCEWGYSHEQIRNTPTIIPASEESE